MAKFSIYNKSSAEMLEVSSNSVDLIVTSPPYNIGTVYGEYKDNLSLEEYRKLLNSFFSESYRILKEEGTIIIECADSVVVNGTYIQLAGYVQSLCLSIGLSLTGRHVNFVNSDGGKELPDHGLNLEYSSDKNAHSNCHQIMVFSKSKDVSFKKDDGRILYFNYVESKDHPCPISSEVKNFVLENYYKEGFVVADVFMGTAELGVEVLKRGGSFIGFELEKTIFCVAQENLDQVS